MGKYPPDAYNMTPCGITTEMLLTALENENSAILIYTEKRPTPGLPAFGRDAYVMINRTFWQNVQNRLPERRHSVEDEEEKLLKQLSLGRITVIQAVALGCYGAQLTYDLHNLDSIIKPHRRDILACLPDASQLKPQV